MARLFRKLSTLRENPGSTNTRKAACHAGAYNGGRSGHGLSALVLTALVGMTACGVAVEDRTPRVVARNQSSVYTLTARVETAGPNVSINSVDVVTPYGTLPMMPSSAPLEWVAQLQLDECVNGFDVEYVVEWQSPPAGNTKHEPRLGAHQKWLDGAPPSGCNAVTGHLYSVTSTADLPDDAPGDGVCRAEGESACTLRAAIMEANAHAGQDRVELGGATYTLTRSGTDDNALNGDLDITDEVALTGDGAVIDGGSIGDRVVDVNPTGDAVDVELRGITIRGGKGDLGGGIRNKGRLHLVEVAIRDNVSQHGGASTTTTAFSRLPRVTSAPTKRAQLSEISAAAL